MRELIRMFQALTDTKVNDGDHWHILSCNNCGAPIPETFNGFDGTLLDLVDLAMKHHEECK